LFTSLFVSTHWSVHQLCPEGQQLPMSQPWPAGQTLPHALQLFASVFVSTQPLSQHELPAAPQSEHMLPPLPQVEVSVPATQLPPLVQPVQVWVHAPAAQPSVVLGLPSSQVAHAPPLAPQAVGVSPGTQSPPDVQVVHAWTHDPALHESVVKALPSLQSASARHWTQPEPSQKGVPPAQTSHVAPLVPQAAVLVPETQAPPLAHPLSQQAPATQCPPTQAMSRSVVWQLPLTQLFCVHALPSSQSASTKQPTQRAMPSSQIVGDAQGSPACAAQVPPAQVSAPSQKVPSSQRTLFAGCSQPLPPQRSSVQTLPSSHAASLGK